MLGLETFTIWAQFPVILAIWTKNGPKLPSKFAYEHVPKQLRECGHLQKAQKQFFCYRLSFNYFQAKKLHVNQGCYVTNILSV